MNTGVIASRYAKALLKYVGDLSDGDVLCSQVLTLEKALREVPQLREAVVNPTTVSADRKVELLRSALGGDMHPSLESFIRLVLDHGREEYLKIILHDFADQYFRQHKLLRASLVSAVKSEKLEASLTKLVKDSTGCDVIIESAVNPDIIGGFIFTVDDARLDASVTGQLASLRRKFIENNKSII